MARFGRMHKWLLWLIAIVVVLGVVIAFLPALASIWPGPGIVRSIIRKQVAEDVDIEVGDVTLRWAGPHTIRDVVLRDPDSTAVTRLNVDLDTTFLQLALSRVEHYRIVLSGEVTGAIHEDGSTSFAKLLPPKSAEAEPEQPDATDRPRRIEGLPAVDVDVLNFTVHLDDTSRGQPVDVAIRTASFSLAAGQPVSFNVDGQVTRGDQTGQLSMGGAVKQLISADGTLTPRGATLSMKAHLAEAPLPVVREVQRIGAFDLSAVSDDLAERIDVNLNTTLALEPPADADASADWPKQSTLQAELVLHHPVDDRLNVTIDPTSISGSLRAASIPAGLLQPFVADTPIVVCRDIGSQVDLEAQVAGVDNADEAGAAGRSAVSANIRSGNLTAELSGSADPATRAMDIESFSISTTIHPALLTGFANTVSIASNVPVTITGTSLRLPGVDKDGARDLAALAGNVELTAQGPFELLVATAGASNSLGTLRNVRLAAGADRLADGLSVDADAGIETGSLTINERITGLVDADGALNTDWRQLQPVGTLTLRDLPLDNVTKFAANLPPALASYLVGAVSAEIATQQHEDDRLAAAVSVTAPQFTITAEATRQADQLVIEAAGVDATIRPELLAELQKSSAAPIGLDHAFPASVHLIEPLQLPADERAVYRLPDQRLTLAIDTTDPIILTGVPALVEPLELRETSLHVMAPLTAGAAQQYRLVGAAQWHTRSTDRTVGDLAFEVNWPAGNAPPAQTGTVDLSLQQIAVRRLERAIGREVDSIAQWIGAFGDFYITADINPATRAMTGTIEPDLRQFAGAFDFTWTEDNVIELTGNTSKLTLTAEAMNNALNMTEAARLATAQSADPAMSAGSAYVSADVPAGLEINRLRTPLKLLNDQPVDPAQVSADIVFTAGPLILAQVAGDSTEVTGVRAQVRADDLRNPVTLDIAGDVQTTDTSQPARLKLNGSLRDVMTDDSRVKLAHGRINLTASGSELPTAVVDGLGNFDGLLVAAIGPVARADLEATDFSPDTGTVDGKLEADHATLSALLFPRGGKLRVHDEQPLVARLELTPELRDRILQSIHPIFADVRQVDERIVVRMTDGGIPLNGDVSELDADLEIVVGDLELTSSSLFLGLLRLGQVTGKEMVRGRIDPIEAKIRKGVLTYDTFSMTIDKYSMAWGGKIDLVTGDVDLRTELPLQALGQTFGELEQYVKDVAVPIRSTGKVGHVKHEVDPQFDMQKALRNALNAAGADQLLQRQLGDFGKLFGNPFKPSEKDQNDTKNKPQQK